MPGDTAIIERLNTLTEHVMYLEAAVKRMLIELGAPELEASAASDESAGHTERLPLSREAIGQSG